MSSWRGGRSVITPSVRIGIRKVSHPVTISPRVRALFWISSALLVWTQAAYAPALALLRRLKGSPPVAPGGDVARPLVSLVVAAYNEEAVIADKVANALALDWPRDRLEVIVAVDGAGTRPRRARGPPAPTRCSNCRAAARSRPRTRPCAPRRGELIAFSDANAMWAPDALRRADQAVRRSGVGYVCGHVEFVNEAGTNQEGLYWRYDMWLRAQESALASVTARQRRDLRRPPRGLPRDRPDHGPRPVAAVPDGQGRPPGGLPAGRARDREDGPEHRGRVGAQAADDVPRVADRRHRRAGRPARVPAAVRADDRQPPPAALRHAAAARARSRSRRSRCWAAARVYRLAAAAQAALLAAALAGGSVKPGRCSSPATTC